MHRQRRCQIFSLWSLIAIVALNIENAISKEINVLNDLISVSEEQVKLLAVNIENSYLSRCNNTDCLKNSLNTCASHSCSKNIVNLQQCLFSDFKYPNCQSNGVYGIINKSTVKTADKFFPNVDINGQDVKELICSSSSVDSKMKTLFSSSSAFIKHQFFGSYNGFFRQYPGGDYCTAYDHRTKPWYVGAATSPANVIIILDTSGSMNNSGKKEAALKAVTELINTLTPAFWLGLVTFSDEAKQYNQKLVRATVENQQTILNYINNNITFIGKSNYDNAFVKAFDIISYTKSLELGSTCGRDYLLFISGGKPSLGEQSAEQLSLNINKLNAAIKAVPIFYSIGKTELDFLMTISCQSNGLYYQIDSMTDVTQTLLNYHLIFSAGVTRTEAIWTYPYVDEHYKWNVTTVAYPVFDRETKPPYLLGVVGLNILTDSFLNMKNGQDLLPILAARTQDCVKANEITDCHLESLRPIYSKCNSDSKKFEEKCKDSNIKHSICQTAYTTNLLCKGTTVVDNLGLNECCVNNTNSNVVTDDSDKDEQQLINPSSTKSSTNSTINLDSASLSSNTSGTMDYSTNSDGSSTTDNKNATSYNNSNFYVIIAIVLIVIGLIYCFIKKRQSKLEESNNFTLMTNQNRDNYFN